MSAKNLDKHNRWRNKTVAFRVSPEEDAQIETAVKLTGLTKQDYIIRRLLYRDVVVQGNPRVYKALRNQLAAVLDELRRIEAGQGVNDELLPVVGRWRSLYLSASNFLFPDLPIFPARRSASVSETGGRDPPSQRKSPLYSLRQLLSGRIRTSKILRGMCR